MEIQWHNAVWYVMYIHKILDPVLSSLRITVVRLTDSRVWLACQSK